MAPRKPGRAFWVWTFIIGIFSPGKGKRRIHVRMQEIWQELCTERDRNSELTTEVLFLRQELNREHDENQMFRLQDDMNAIVFMSSVSQDTVPLYTTSQALANVSPGNTDAPENPPESLRSGR